MKRICFSIIMCLLCCGSPMQAQQPLFEDGKIWMVYTGDLFDYHSTDVLILLGDTLVNGKTYHKSYFSKSEDLSDLKELTWLYREEGGKTYAYSTIYKREHLLHNCNLNLGESYIYENIPMVGSAKSYKLTLKEMTDTLLPYPKPTIRKKWRYSLSFIEEDGREVSSKISVTYIDGIGNLVSGIGCPYFNSDSGVQVLNCCYAPDGELVYRLSEEVPCFRSSTNAIRNMSQDEAGGLKVTESAGGRLVFAWNAGAGYRTLSLYSAEGRLVARQRPTEGETSAAFTGLPRGTYIYFFTAGGETKASGKVLVE